MKQAGRTIVAAFARYSKIPMPALSYQEEDLVYHLLAFPLVGLVIGLLCYAMFRLAMRLAFPSLVTALLLLAVPILVTGGFHLDGFLDVEDALASYRSKEERLQILKDPHIGAFAVIRLLLYVLLVGAALLLLLEQGQAVTDMRCLIPLFALSRAVCGVTILTNQPAKAEGMLATEATSAARAGRRNRRGLYVEILILSIVLFAFSPRMAVGCLLAVAISLLWYHRCCIRSFGGITGDTAGYLITWLEGAVVICCAIVSRIG